MLVWTSAQATDIGAKRKINEDAVLSRPDIGLWAVADGMGGHAAGDVASQAVIDALCQVTPDAALSDCVDAIEDKLLLVNQNLRRHGQEALGGRTLGTTVVSLFVLDGMGACLWAGDSRLYQYRAGVLRRVSHDHSAVQEMIDSGMITADQAAHHPTVTSLPARSAGETSSFRSYGSSVSSLKIGMCSAATASIMKSAKR